MKHNFEERKQNRVDHAHKQAAKNEKLSEQSYNEASKMASIIPMGQPILIGHHSENADRNYRKRIDNKFRKSVEAEKKAEYYKDKAVTIENNQAIFDDDPKAVDKLKAKLKDLEDLQAFMKAANQCIRKQDKTAFLTLPHATEKMWEQLNTRDCFNGMGYASYKLTNNNANIRRIKQRIAQQEQITRREAGEITFNGGLLRENKEANRIQFVFEAKPDEAVRKMLKGEGFRWSPTEGAWQRHLNANGIFAARQIVKQMLPNNNAE